jgi:hypothetical protein
MACPRRQPPLSCWPADNPKRSASAWKISGRKFHQQLMFNVIFIHHLSTSKTPNRRPWQFVGRCCSEKWLARHTKKGLRKDKYLDNFMNMYRISLYIYTHIYTIAFLESTVHMYSWLVSENPTYQIRIFPKMLGS